MGRYNPRDESPPKCAVAWTTTPVDYDADDPAVAPGGMNACGVEVGTAGTLVMTLTDGTSVTIPSAIFTANPYFRCQFKALGAASTAQNVVVFW